MVTGETPGMGNIGTGQLPKWLTEGRLLVLDCRPGLEVDV